MARAGEPAANAAGEIRLVQSPVRPALVLATAVLLAAICVAMAVPLFPQAQLTPKQHLYWWFGAFFFALGAVAVFKTSFGATRPVLTLSPEGFHFTTVSARPIPWTSVLGVHNWRQRRNQILIVKVTEETWDTAGLTPEALGARAGNKVQGIDGVAISPAGLPMNFRQLADAFHAYHARYGKVS